MERGDSLSAIAGRVRPEGASLQQTMLAIYRANPDAFFGSMNNLKAGVSLYVPGQTAIASVDPAEAQRAFRVAIQEYRAYRERLAAAVPTVRASESGRTAEGRIGERAAAPAAPAATQDRLELSRPSTAAPAAGTGTGTSGATAAADTEEARVARSAALSEATSRVSELERNVANLQRLLELKDQQLAQVQQRLEAAESAARTATGAIAPAPAARTAPAATPGVAPAQGPAARAPSAPASATSGPRVGETQSPAASVSVPLQPSVPPVATPQTQAPQPQQLASQQQAQRPAAQQPAAQPASAAPAAAVAPATPPAPAAQRSEPSFLESLLDNPILLPALGGLAILGAGYAWYAVRRRRREENFEDSLIATDAFSANSLFGSTGGQNVDTAASGLTTHTGETSMTVASTEVDPIAEAEVYIAYGREAQAEEILREALRKQPERHAVRLKLLEIYSGRKDVDAFNALAREMAEQGGASSDEWPKVVSLGRALDPADPLYGDSAGAARADARPTGGESGGAASGSGAAGLAAGAAMAAAQFVAADQARAKPDASRDSEARDDEAQGEDRREEARLEWKVPAAEPAAVQDFDDTAPLGMSAGDGDDAGDGDERLGALDFDLDLDTTVDKAAERLSRKFDDELPTIDDAALDSLSMFEPEIDDEPRVGTAPASGARRTEASAESADQAVMLDESEPLDFRVDLPSLDDLDAGKARRAGESAQAVKPDLDLSAISLDLSAPAAQSEARGADETNPRWQEMATKLDLASAYEEIGDKEGARELLDEVLRSGDAAQQKRARELLERIT